MAATASQFLLVFPEFANLPGANPGAISFWLAQANNQLALGVLGANADLAGYLFVAHNLTLNAQDLEDANDGALPGDTLGPVSSEAAGGLSVTYDTGMVAMEGAGPYNATSYGQRLWKMIQAASVGGVYVPGPVRPTVFFGWRRSV